MSISEKSAIDQLVTDGLLKEGIAAILKSLPRDRDADAYNTGCDTSTLLVVAVDKSSSIKNRGLTQAVIDGQHHLINSLLGATSAMKIAMGQLLFNERVDRFQDISPLRDLDNTNRAHPSTKWLDGNTYVPTGGTALYDTVLASVAMGLATVAVAFRMGRIVIAKIAIVTDGVDEHSKLKEKPELVKQVLDYVLDNGLIDRITLYGVGTCDYRAIATRIGIRDVIEVDADPKAIRRAFGVISSQVIGGVQ